MNNRLNLYFKKFSIPSDFQPCFKKESSTCDAITEYVDGVYCTIDRKNDLFAVFLNFEKAFDTVDYAILLILLSKLENVGIKGPIF